MSIDRSRSVTFRRNVLAAEVKFALMQSGMDLGQNFNAPTTLNELVDNMVTMAFIQDNIMLVSNRIAQDSMDLFLEELSRDLPDEKT